MRRPVTLRHPTLDEVQQVRIWRNAPDVLLGLRTKAPLTEAQQAAFFRDVVSNPTANHRYYAIDWHCGDPIHQGEFIGLGGLTYLDRVPGQAEISLILGPAWRSRGLGHAAVEALLEEAFGPLGLTSVIGECFSVNPAKHFWVHVMQKMIFVRSDLVQDVRYWTSETALHWVWSHQPKGTYAVVAS